MHEELDAQLCAEYPELFAQRHVQDSLMSYGFCCGDGWFPLIYVLCRSLQHRIEHHGEPQIQVVEVKATFGQLRFHVFCEAGEMSDAQCAVIEMAEILSAGTCDECGCPGLCVSNEYSAVVRCPAHEQEGSSADEECV
jgi:hypothetical protein